MTYCFFNDETYRMREAYKIKHDVGHIQAHAESTLLTIREVASRLGMKPSTIRAWIRLGRLPCVKLGRTVRVKESVVEDIIQNGLERASK